MDLRTGSRLRRLVLPSPEARPSGTWAVSYVLGLVSTISNVHAATYSVTIPTQIAAGEYLLRIEQLAIHNPGSPPQFYISCAQIKVTGGGSGSPSPVTKIPGHVKKTDSGYTANIYSNFNSVGNPDVRTACETYADFVHQHLVHCSRTQGCYLLEHIKDDGSLMHRATRSCHRSWALSS
jgi:hypothetical protein